VNNHLIWSSDVVDWEKIAVDSYKFIMDRATERLNEVIEESHAITKRGMAILLSHIAALSGFIGYLFSDKSKIIHENAPIIILAAGLALLSLYAFSLLVKLIYPKEVFYKGSPPKEIFFKDVFHDLSEEEGLKSVLFDEIIRMQDKIERMEEANNTRIVPYKKALKISLFFIAVVIILAVKTISS
jgi:hypothetical protein